MPHQVLPSGATEADRVARSLARLRGPEIQPRDSSLIAEDLRAQGQALALARAGPPGSVRLRRGLLGARPRARRPTPPRRRTCSPSSRPSTACPTARAWP